MTYYNSYNDITKYIFLENINTIKEEIYFNNIKQGNHARSKRNSKSNNKATNRYRK